MVSGLSQGPLWVESGLHPQGRKRTLKTWVGPRGAQRKAFNQTSALCRGYEDKAGKAHLVYSTLLFADDPCEHFRTQMLACTGCIGEFRNFLKDPNDYLATAP